jgi:hypothetical protein
MGLRMTERDPRCVLAVPERQAAELIAAWLTEKGIPAETVARPPGAATDSLTLAATAVPGEFQVWVVNLVHAAEARELVEERQAGVQALREREARRAGRTGTTTAACEECGESSEWPANSMGTTQTCPHCHAYMDVPDPDENLDEWGFAEEPGEDGRGQ